MLEVEGLQGVEPGQRREVAHRGVLEVEGLQGEGQRREVRVCRAGSPASGARSLTLVLSRYEALQGCEPGQRREVAHRGAVEVEGLQGGEPGQRREVAHRGAGEVEGLQGVEPGQRREVAHRGEWRG